MSLKTHHSPNQRTELGFIVSDPAYCAMRFEQGSPLAYWWTHDPELPLLSALARYVRERVMVAQAEQMPPTRTNITHPDD